MDLAKKIFHFLSTILFYSIVLILGIVFLMVIVTFVDKKISLKNGKTGSPLFGAYVIVSESMIPHINVYDAVVIARAKEEQIHIDDIITFLSKEIETAGTPITHRVIGIVHDPNDESKIIGYRTKGDHNNTADFALITPNEVIGKVFLRIPMIGYLQIIMTKPIGWLLIIFIPCLLVIGNDIFKLLRTSKLSKNKENEIDDKYENNISSLENQNVTQYLDLSKENNLSNQNSQQDNFDKSSSLLDINSQSDDENTI